MRREIREGLQDYEDEKADKEKERLEEESLMRELQADYFLADLEQERDQVWRRTVFGWREVLEETEEEYWARRDYERFAGDDYEDY